MTSEKERDQKSASLVKKGMLLFVVYVVTSLAYPSGLERERREAVGEQDGQQGERERRSKSS